MPDTLDVERRVRDIIARLFDLSPDQANDHLRMGNPPEWDSFGHVQLLFTIEPGANQRCRSGLQCSSSIDGRLQLFAGFCNEAGARP